jgi:hypothetical protein
MKATKPPITQTLQDLLSTIDWDAVEAQELPNADQEMQDLQRRAAALKRQKEALSKVPKHPTPQEYAEHLLGEKLSKDES